MDYYYLNADCVHSEYEPVVLKVSKRAHRLAGEMGALARKHGEIERVLIKELSEINDISEDEISDILADNDFFVDASQYGTGFETAKTISKKEFEELRKKMEIY